ncbi:hypothetical protein [Stygiolobus caldivivus]|uniref:Uncharacterized protein n=1 Tax=Stygiolobus caldivivus TaxID=2824673 RepID=A0A8D5U624_9CREN|nr:hypothetical protein [Stygiolobus caldivivus]BCU70255.1 hypothetical protein KN1_15520 [Stygiolobus caldivivus]
MNKETVTIFILLLSLGVTALSVFYYYNIGTYNYVGSYNGYPLYWYTPFLPAVVVSIISFTLGILLVFTSLNPSEKRLKISLISVFALLLVSLLVARFSFGFSTEKILLELPSPTDAQLIQLLASKSLLDGHNPYTENFARQMLSSLAPQQYTWIFKSGTNNYTPSNIIGFVHVFDYLPSAALYYLPAVALGIPANIYNSIILAVGSALIFHRLKGKNKALFPLLLSSFMFIYFAPLLLYRNTAGWLIPFVIAILFPDNPLLAGAMLAWASTYRLYVLIFTIFYLILLSKEGYNVKDTIKYGLVFALLLDAPFVLLNPTAFINDNLIPFLANFRPYDGGPGLVSLTYFGITIDKIFYYLGLSASLVIGLVLSLKYYHKLSYGILTFPLISFFFYYRPLPSYYLYFLPLIFLSYIFIVRKGDINIDLSSNSLARISSYSLVLGLLSIIYMYGVYTFGVLLNLEIGLSLFILFAITPLIIYFRDLVFKINSWFIFIIIVLVSVMILGFIPSQLHGTNFVLMGHGYIGDAMLLPNLASESIIKGINPYTCNFQQIMARDPYFGSLYKIIPYSDVPINLTSINASKVFTPYYTPKGTYMYYGLPTDNVTFYDYPPMNAIFLIPAHLLHIPIRLWEPLTYEVAITALFLQLLRRKEWEKSLALVVIILSGYFVSLYGFTFLLDSTSWIVFIILGMAFYDIPFVFGLMTGLAIDSMPQAIVLFPFLLIYVYEKMGKDYFKQYFLTAVLSALLILLPFVLTYPESLYLMLFPVIAKLPMAGIGITTLLGTAVYHTVWPLSSFKPIPYITLAITLTLGYLLRKRLGEVLIMLPMYIILTFTRSYPEYLLYYPYIAFLLWITMEKMTSYQGIKISNNNI